MAARSEIYASLRHEDAGSVSNDNSESVVSGTPVVARLVFAASLVSLVGTSGAAVLKFQAGTTRTDDVGAVSNKLQFFDEADSCYQAMMDYAPDNQYNAITGKNAHEWPELFGNVREQTIWSFWFDDDHCRNRDSCEMPTHVRLCAETVEKNKGDFDYRIIFIDEVERYVNAMELPLYWRLLNPRQLKDAVMNAILARYGGIFLDITTVLFDSFNDDWNNMVDQRAAFKGYVYRLNGESFSEPAVTATWFAMARRESLFAVAALNQHEGMCGMHLYPDLSLGDATVTPALIGVHPLPLLCSNDTAVQDKDACPELSMPLGHPTDPRTDRTLLLEDPRDGPELPFARIDSGSMGSWDTESSDAVDGVEACGTKRACYELFVKRLEQKPLKFVKLFNTGGKLWKLNDEGKAPGVNTFFGSMLLKAGLTQEDIVSSPERRQPVGLAP